MREVEDETLMMVLPKVLICQKDEHLEAVAADTIGSWTYIEVCEIDGPKVEKHTDTIQAVRWLSKSAPFDQRSQPSWREANTCDGYCDYSIEEHNESHDADGPCKPNFRKQLLGYQRKDDTTCSTA